MYFTLYAIAFLQFLKICFSYFSFQNLTCEPAYLFVFCTSALFEQHLYAPSKNQTRRPRQCQQQAYDVNSYITSLAPPSCRCYSVAADGIIGMEIFTQLYIKNYINFGLIAI